MEAAEPLEDLRGLRVPEAFLANRQINTDYADDTDGRMGKALSLSVKSVKSVVSLRSESLLNAWMKGKQEHNSRALPRSLALPDWQGPLA